MKWVIILASLLVFLAACQQAAQIDDGSIDEHMGCQETDIIDGTCSLADEGNKNLDLFSGIGDFQVVVTDVEYTEGAMGFYAVPSAEGVYPGVIMIHEWWGLNDNIKDMARLLANEGYGVMAVDLYNGEVAEDSSRAGTLAGAVRNNPEAAIENMREAANFLRGLAEVDSERIASMGWCFGGGQSLNLALSGENLIAIIIYYGSLTSDEEALSVIKQPILGIFGEDDTSITVDSVRAFEEAINNLGIENEIHIYPGVGHAFANPSGTSYAPDETLDAWDKTLSFLEVHLKA